MTPIFLGGEKLLTTPTSEHRKGKKRWGRLFRRRLMMVQTPGAFSRGKVNTARVHNEFWYVAAASSLLSDLNLSSWSLWKTPCLYKTVNFCSSHAVCHFYLNFWRTIFSIYSIHHSFYSVQHSTFYYKSVYKVYKNYLTFDIISIFSLQTSLWHGTWMKYLYFIFSGSHSL